MIIDIDPEYIINENINLPKAYYEQSEIQDIKNLKVVGKFYLDNDKIHGILTIDGIMMLLDSISLERIEYPFSIKYDDILEENLKKDANKLDLFEFLWENIVLEVPLKFTKVEDLSKFHGDGWKLISEEENNDNFNPFNELLKNFDKKE